MKRRTFITLLGGAAAAWPLTARAQQAMPVIGWLSNAVAAEWGDLIEAFRQGLKEAGYVEGRNVAIEFRWAEGDNARLPALAEDLVRQRVTVIFTSGGHLPALVAKAATTTIPIVFLSGNDPIEFGLVTSLSRPTGNVTGLSMLASALGPKQLGLLHDLIPRRSAFNLRCCPSAPSASLMPCSHRLPGEASASSSPTIPTCEVGPASLSPWRHVMRFPWSTRIASSPRPAV
jgi:putative ABC transport system substrate-binding protein